MDWVARQPRTGPLVVTMSLGVPEGSWSRALSATARSLVREHGVVVVVA